MLFVFPPPRVAGSPSPLPFSLSSLFTPSSTLSTLFFVLTYLCDLAVAIPSFVSL